MVDINDEESHHVHHHSSRTNFTQCNNVASVIIPSQQSSYRPTKSSVNNGQSNANIAKILSRFQSFQDTRKNVDLEQENARLAESTLR